MATTTNYSWTLPTVGGSDNTWGTSLNANWTALDALLGGTNATEFAILDGAAITTTELNYLSGADSNIQSQIDAIVAGGSPGDGTITISTSSGLSGGGDFTVNQATNSTISVQGVTQSTATWEAGTSTTEGVVSPSKVKSAIEALASGIGDGQTWQVVTRSAGTSYQNTTGKPIMVAVGGVSNNPWAEISTNGSTWVALYNVGNNQRNTASFIVPNNHYYRVGSAGATINLWSELR